MSILMMRTGGLQYLTGLLVGHKFYFVDFVTNSQCGIYLFTHGTVNSYITILNTDISNKTTDICIKIIYKLFMFPLFYRDICIKW